MINLMYIVLTAMLALNVSSDVLNGFRMVHESLQSTVGSMTAKSERQFEYLTELYKANPRKMEATYKRGKTLHDASNELYNYIDSLKTQIARAADGPKGSYSHLKNEDDLNASAAVMLDPTSNRGRKLREQIDAYVKMVSPLVDDPQKRKMLTSLLSTKVPAGPGQPSWETRMFDNMPAVAAITMLSKLQYDIRTTESEAMNNLVAYVDLGEGLRVNELRAFVVPESSTVMSGGQFSAHIVLAAVDTLSRPSIYVGGTRITNKDGLYQFTVGAPGEHSFSGYIEMLGSDGLTYKRDFTQKYTVIAPMATISPTMMNVLYMGIDNPISISAPGVPMTAIQASMTNGTLTRNGDTWVARPAKIGAEAEINVSANMNGKVTQLGSMKFRVRKLPDPTPYLAIGETAYKGTPRRISKGALLGCRGVSAALDDDILQINFSVVSFSVVFYDQMGNAIPEVSAGSAFSARQIEKFKQMKPGKSFFITNVKAKGPDGVVRDISPMEVGIN